MNEVSKIWTDVVIAGNPLWRVCVFFVAVLAGLILGRVGRAFLLAASARLIKQGRWVSAAACSSAVAPYSLMLFLAGFQSGVQFLVIPEWANALINVMISVLWAFGLFWLAFNEVDVLDVWMMHRAGRTASAMDEMLAPLIRKSVRITIFMLGLLQVVTMLSNKSLTSIIAGLGVGGLAVALAAQETIKNYFGSILIFADKPFEVGDRILVDGYDGPVEKVGMRSTRIRTLEGHLVTIPNGILSNKSIENIGKRTSIRRILDLSIVYNTPPAKVDRAVQVLKEILNNHEGMSADLPPRIYFSDFKDSALNLNVTYWFQPPDYWLFMQFNEKVNREILRRFNEEGISFAFPTTTVHLAKQSP
jgi:MscS family membrane protein